ncbi:MAG TPA: hypothetical protein VNM69_23095 [Bacillus sp. (in: firmicutes)]|nr:hypothetical protein [Bacillus sp. (in: firmicutes)]
MPNKTCREEILQAIHSIINAKKKNEFTVKEVIQLLVKNNTVYKEGTIRTHITSRCCTNSPKNHQVVYSHFERIKPGLYKLVK